MADLATAKRTLQIKTGAVKRLSKEETSYFVEAQQQEVRIQKFIDEGRDEYDVKKQKEVLQDSLKMIPDCRKRLEIAVDDLLVYFNGLQNDQSVKETQEYTGAQEALAEAQEKLSAPVQV